MKEKNKGLAAGAAIGAMIGVVTGILFAPKSGKETRQDIKDSAVKIATKLQEEAKKIQIELGELIDVAESKAMNAGKAVTAKTQELIENAKQTRETLVELAHAVKAGEADDEDLNDAIKKANESKEALKVYLKK